MIGRQENFWILDALQWLKQPFNSLYFETLSFFPLFLFLLFATQKSWGPCLPPRPSRRVADPDIYQKDPMELNFESPECIDEIYQRIHLKE